MNYPSVATNPTLAGAEGLKQKGYAMPYASKAQQGYMHAKHPEIAKRWDKETAPGQWKGLPQKVRGIKAMCAGTVGKKK